MSILKLSEIQISILRKLKNSKSYYLCSDFNKRSLSSLINKGLVFVSSDCILSISELGVKTLSSNTSMLDDMIYGKTLLNIDFNLSALVYLNDDFVLSGSLGSLLKSDDKVCDYFKGKVSGDIVRFNDSKGKWLFKLK